MKKLNPVAVLLLIAGLAGANDLAPWSPDLAFKVKRVGPVRLSPDGNRAAFVVGNAVLDGEKSEWLSQVWVVGADGSGAVQLTQADKSSTAPAWSPDGQWIVFVSARGKDEGGKDAKANLWRIRVDGGEAEPLTEDKGGAAAPQFSPDGKWIAFLLTDAKTDDEDKADKEKRDARVVDEGLKRIRLAVIPTGADAQGKRPVRRLTGDAMSVGSGAGPGSFDWAPDSRTIAFSHQPEPTVDVWTKGDVSVVDVASGAIRPLAVTRRAESSPSHSPDGRWIAVQASADPPTWGGSSRVYVYPASGGEPKALALTFDEQPNIVGWTADGRRILVRETRGTVSRVTALPADGSPGTDLTPADINVEAPSLSRDGRRLGFVVQAPDQAVEAYVADVASEVPATAKARTTGPAFRPVQISRVQDVPKMALGRTDVLTWTANDGREIEGLLTYPVGYAEGTRVPLLVVVHGGPAGVFVRSFTATPSPYPIAGFASRGYAVLRCNVRGSSGYGREFRHLNYKDWGGGDYKDILAGVDAVVAKGIADPERMGIMGWSYGGYMTSWVITQTRRFKAASVGAGVTNLVSFTGTADIPSFIPDYFGGEYWDVIDAWKARSAIFNVKGVTTPTLIQHGEQDLRVPISQGYELYNALKRQGVKTKMVVYPRQPHGIQEPKLLLDAMTRNLDWFDRHVLGKDVAWR